MGKKTVGCWSCGFQLEDDQVICPRCSANQFRLHQGAKRRSHWISWRLPVVIVGAVLVLIAVGYAISGTVEESSGVLVTRPATDVVLTPDALGNGWSGTIIGSDAEAYITLENSGIVFNVHILKFTSHEAARSYYDNDIFAMNGSSLNIGEAAVLIPMGQYSKQIEFLQGNIVAVLLWNTQTYSFSDYQMEQFAKAQSVRIGWISDQ